MENEWNMSYRRDVKDILANKLPLKLKKTEYYGSNKRPEKIAQPLR